MAWPIKGVARPGLHTHRSYHGHEDTNRQSVEGGTSPISTYEDYEIKPRESPLGEARGRWYRADTKRMPTSQRDLQDFVRKEWSNGYSIVDTISNKKMVGSKRVHIRDFIASKVTDNPGWDYQLVFLKLERNPKKRDSRKPRPKTLSMRIILECKLRLCNNMALSVPRSMSSQSQVHINGGLAPTYHRQGSSMQGTVTAPINTPMPQYVPAYIRQGAPSWQNSPPRAQSSKVFTPPVSRTTPYESDESVSFTPASPSSTLSSDTARSSSRRPSYSSSPIDTLPTFLSKTVAHCAQGSHNNGAQCSYVSHSTQTDMKGNSSDNNRPALTGSASPKLREQPKKGAENGNSCVNAPVLYEICSKGDNIPSIDEHSDKQGIPKLGNTHDIAFEKPAWMNNMQPVNTPTVINENVDCVTDGVAERPVTKYEGDSVADAPIKESHSLPEETKLTPGRGQGPTNPPSHVSRPVLKTASPATTPKTSSGHIPDNGGPMRKDVNISEYLSGLSIATGRRDGYFPPPPSFPNPQQQPLKASTSTSPPQPKSKSVRFDLSPHVSTVPSTPTKLSPPSSPTSTISSSSTESFWSPKTPPRSPHADPSPRRPPFPRSPHSTSTPLRPAHPPPRSPSYSSSAPSHPPPTPLNRRQSSSTHYPSHLPYECKKDRCRASGFASGEGLSLHMRSVHGMEHRGSI